LQQLQASGERGKQVEGAEVMARKTILVLAFVLVFLLLFLLLDGKRSLGQLRMKLSLREMKELEVEMKANDTKKKR